MHSDLLKEVGDYFQAIILFYFSTVHLCYAIILLMTRLIILSPYFVIFSIFKVIEKEAVDNQEHINFTLEAMTSHLSKGEA